MGAFLHNPEKPAYHSFQVSRSECIGTIAFAKYSSKSVKICTLVTGRWHKLETCSTVTPTTENTEHSTGFTHALGFRSLISAQCECWYWHMPAVCVLMGFFPLFCHQSHCDNNNDQFYPQSAVTFSHCFGDFSLFMRHISQVRRFDKPQCLLCHWR